jgi:HSP20 family protein
MRFGSLAPWRGKSQLPSSRDDFLDPFVSMRREMDRVFDDFFGGLEGSATRAVAPWQSVTPALDVKETDKEVVVTAELPGLDEKDFEVTLNGDILTLKGEKKQEDEKREGDAHYVERRYGSFSRSVRLPFSVKDEAVEANYDKGVLTVRIPKPAEAQNNVRRIEVKKSA